MSFSDVVKVWDKFWFTEGSPLPVAAYRFLFGMLTFFNFLCLIPDVYNFYGSRGIIGLQATTDWTGCSGLNIFNFMENNDTFMIICFSIFVLASLCLCLGFYSRLSAIICFVGLNTIYHRDPFVLNGGDTYMRVSMFWLIFAASGNAISLDRMRKKKEAEDLPGLAFDNYKPVSNWPLRLLQFQLGMVYCHTFFRKFYGQHWFDGVAVYYSSRVEDLRRLPLPFIFDHMWTIQALTFGTLVMECALFTLIWFKETRYIVLAGATLFHLTIEYHMNIPFFEWLMIASYVLFIYPEDLAKILRYLQNRRVGESLKIANTAETISTSAAAKTDTNGPATAP